jgi:hypothetical protein
MSSTMTDRIRTVTDEEVAFYEENGWVKLDQLLSPDLAAELLARAKHHMGPEGDANQLRDGIDLVGHQSWHDYHDIADEDELFEAVGYGVEIGRSAQRLMQREVGVRAYANMLAVKLGKKQQTRTREYAKTDFHQDFPTLAMDRTGYLGFWIALDEVTPDMGGLRFHTKSHRLGSLGRIGWFEDRDLFQVYPNLGQECPLSPELHYRPGDATVHHGFTVHGAPENVTDHPRWAFLVGFFPADTKYTGAMVAGDEHLRDGERYGLQIGQPFDHPAFRLVHP